MNVLRERAGVNENLEFRRQKSAAEPQTANREPRIAQILIENAGRKMHKIDHNH
jgi:hypothetical protein